MDELGQKSWALTPSSHRDQGINDTQVKALLEVLENGSLTSEGLSSEGQPCQQSGPGEIFPDQHSRSSSLHSVSLFSASITLYFIVWMVIIHLSCPLLEGTETFPIFCSYEAGAVDNVYTHQGYRCFYGMNSLNWNC